MRILVISDSLDYDGIRRQFSKLCEPHSLLFSNDIEDAKSIIGNSVIKHQQPLDLIIINSSVGKRSGNDFRDFIRNDYERIYSKRDFNLSEVPIAIIVPPDLNKALFHGYDLAIDDIGIQKLNKLVPSFSQTIKNWRKKVLEELDSLGIRFNSGIIDYGYFLNGRSVSTQPTKILSENFKTFPRKLNYYWIEFNKAQIERAIDSFINMLKASERIGKKGEEKKYHKFFKDNSSFLLRDSHSKYWYEPRFYKTETEFEEPDFTLKPNMTFETDLSLLEVKLPNEMFMTKNKFHPTFRSKLIRHLSQVNDYKDYLESDQYLSQINKALGFVPQNINYNILIGRLQDKEENEYQLKKRLKQFNQVITLMTFDELMKYQVEYLERMQILDIHQ